MPPTLLVTAPHTHSRWTTKAATYAEIRSREKAAEGLIGTQQMSNGRSCMIGTYARLSDLYNFGYEPEEFIDHDVAGNPLRIRGAIKTM